MVALPDQADPKDALSLDLVRRELEAGLGELSSQLAAPFPDITNQRVEQIFGFLRLLGLWRTRLSLISVESPVRILREHVIDSLAAAPLIGPGTRVGDLGSGAGFPGIPLAVFLPMTHVQLIESRRKRANFLRETVRTVGLKNAEVAEGRGEELSGQHEKFDLLIARAFGTIAETLALGRRLVRSGGQVVTMKGETTVQQTAEIKDRAQIFSYSLPGAGVRKIVVYQI